MTSTTPRTLKVRAAAPSLRVPHEHHPRKYITGAAVAVVPATAYYLRRISDGELIEVVAEAGLSTKPKGK